MNTNRIEHGTIERQTTAGTDILDLTEDLGRFVQSAAIENGLCTLHVAGSTASISTIEFESGAIADLKRALDQLAPMNGDYAHNERWGDGNGYSHVRAALMGPSRSFPIIDGMLALGTWQQVILLDFDNRPRTRTVIVQLLGS